jgi:hypothetical protein
MTTSKTGPSAEAAELAARAVAACVCEMARERATPRRTLKTLDDDLPESGRW